MISESIQFYQDTVIISMLLTDPRIKKTAQSGIVPSLINKTFEYFHDKVSEVEDSDHKLNMLVNFLTPGILTALGFPFLGGLAKVSQMVFGFDFGKVFAEIVSEIKDLISGSGKTTSSAVESTVTKAVMNNLPSDPSEDQVNKLLSLNRLTIREAELFKVALTDYVMKNPDVNLNDPEMNVKFAAGLFNSALGSFLASKNKTTKILIAVISWIVKAALAACGFMVAGDIINSIVGGKSSSIDGQPKNNTNASPSDNSNNTNSSPPVSLPVNPNYSEESFNGPMSRWIISNNITSIDDLLSGWAQDIYPSVVGHENLIRYSSAFKSVSQRIKDYNKGSPPNMIFIPREWKSTKDVVDQFMGEVQKNLGSLPETTKPSQPSPGQTAGQNPIPKANIGTEI